jgi:hypothetical protein
MRAWSLLLLGLLACRDLDKERAQNDANERAIAAASAQLEESERYMRDRAAMRAARPKTEADAIRVVGRQPDEVREMLGVVVDQWNYEDRPGGRDLIQVTVRDGGVIGLNM